MSIVSRFMENVNIQRRDVIYLSRLGYGPLELKSGGFACIWQSKWVGIIVIKTKRTEIHFWVTFSLPSRRSILRSLIAWSRARRDKEITERVWSECVKPFYTVQFDIFYHLSFWHANLFFWKWPSSGRIDVCKKMLADSSLLSSSRFLFNRFFTVYPTGREYRGRIKTHKAGDWV